MKTSVATPLLDLAARIEQLSEILAGEGFKPWADRLATDVAKLRDGDRMGCASFLSHFGGMGSLNDIQVGDSNTDAHFQNLVGSAQVLARQHYPSFLQQLNPSLHTIFIGGLCIAAVLLLWIFAQ